MPQAQAVLALDARPFHARTGRRGYDAIAFSERPLAQPARSQSGSPAGVDVVRHLGVEGGGRLGMLETASRHSDLDAISVNLGGEGRFEGRINGERVQGVLRPDQVSFYPAGTPTAFRLPSAQGALVIHLPRARLREVAADAVIHLPRAELRPMVSADAPEIARCARLIERELARPDFASSLMIDSLVRAMGVLLLRRSSDGAALPPDRIHLPAAKVARVADFVEANLDRAIVLDDLAQVAELSPFHFSRVFKRAVGQTPCQFLRSRRVERACVLLAEGDMALAELALACGFANQSHFTAAFTAAIGLSPGRYRRLRRS